MKNRMKTAPAPQPLEPEVKEDADAEIRERKKKHQAEIRQGTIAIPESEPTPAQLEESGRKARVKEHQNKLKGGIE